MRLVRGARDAEIRYGDDPVAAARRWTAAGGTCLHVIDLGGAFGEPDSVASILAIAASCEVPIQAGGGVRDEERLARLLDGGVSRAILGTRALKDPEFLARAIARHGSERIVVSIDCDGDRLKLGGWEESSVLSPSEAVRAVEAAGVRHLLVTATDRDGTLSGPRLDLFRKVLDGSASAIVAAGGIGSIEHVRSVLDLDAPRLEGVVIGRALYEGTVRLEDALECAAERRGRSPRRG